MIIKLNGYQNSIHRLFTPRHAIKLKAYKRDSINIFYEMESFNILGYQSYRSY